MRRNQLSLVFLHGFLGSPEDWEGVIGHLPEFKCQALSYPFNIPEESIVVGYSMGGRIALRSSQPKVLISTHPGLKTAQEKEHCLKENEKWETQLLSQPLDEFLRKWYDQPLFSTLKAKSQFGEIFVRRSRQNPLELVDMLRKESLAHQSFTLPDNGVFIHGQLDLKYAALYRELGIDSVEISDVGHAAHLEDPEACARAIIEGVSRLA